MAAWNLTLLWTDLGIAALAASFLALEFYASKVLARGAPGFLALILAALAGAAWWLNDGASLAAGCAALAAFCLVAWMANLDAVRLQVSQRLTPKVAWGLVLVASMIMSRYQASQVAASVRRVPQEAVLDFRDVPQRTVRAFTDRAQSVELFHFEMYTPAQAAEQAILAEDKYQYHVIRLAEANAASNCHGWVFTGGQFGIRNPDVPGILADNGYVQVQDVREGDLAIYVTAGQMTHSGIVRALDPAGHALIESKWGPFGVFLHAPDIQPYSGICGYYRSPRAGHLLELRPPLRQTAAPSSGTAD